MIDNKAFAELNGKLRLGISPSHRWVSPLGGDVAQSQPDQLSGSLVVGKAPLIANGLAHAAVQALNGVGGIDELAHRCAEGKERDDLLPAPSPALRHGREPLALRAVLKVAERLFSRLGIGGLVDWLKRLR